MGASWAHGLEGNTFKAVNKHAQATLLSNTAPGNRIKAHVETIQCAIKTYTTMREQHDGPIGPQ